MPIRVSDTLPAIEVLNNENIFVMTETRAITQDIRPLEILILNLMPTKIATETQLLRLLGNTPLQINAQFLRTATHVSKNVSKSHLETFYKSFDEIKDKKFDGLIITGAPVEMMDFEEVDYWDELCKIMEWSKTNVTSTFHICWGAQAGLYYHYGIKKYKLDKKISGIYKHTVNNESKRIMLVRGFDEEFYAPHSRNTTVLKEDIEKVSNLEIVSTSDDVGIYIVCSKDKRQFFVTGHSEYDFDTLKNEYIRDVKAGINPYLPENYFPDDNPENTPKNIWKAHAHLLFSNWLNYYVYQTTPYDIKSI